MQAELKGLYLEDMDALAAASLPFTRSVSFQSGRIGTFDVSQLESAFRMQANRARARLAEIGRHHALAWSFEVAERAAPDQLSAPEENNGAALAENLLLLDRRALRQHHQAAALIRLARSHRSTVALWDPRGPAPREVALVYHGDQDALSLAAMVAQAMNGSIRVLPAGANADETQGLEDEVKAWLAEHHVTAELEAVVMADASALRPVFARTAHALLLVPRTDLIASLAGEGLGQS